jgi:hypothetical protein
VRFFATTIFLLSAACGTNVDLGGTGPTSSDGGIVSKCGDLVSPATDAGCKACDKISSDCQPNGCYGGYWCNVLFNDCEQPPKTCP